MVKRDDWVMARPILPTTPTPAAAAVYDIDGDTRFNTKGGVDHGASARNNLMRVPLDILDAINPTNNILAAAKEIEGITQYPILGELLAMVVALPLIVKGFFLEILELLAMPFFVLKDFGDMWMHSGIYVAERIEDAPREIEQALEPARRSKRLLSPTVELPEPKRHAGVAVKG